MHKLHFHCTHLNVFIFFQTAKWRERCSVDLSKFLIFLYMQHAHVISIKASLVVGEEYPFFWNGNHYNHHNINLNGSCNKNNANQHQ